MTRLIRDVLDNQLVDRKKVKIGKADGIVLELLDGSPPRILAIETGMVTKARRIHPALARCIARYLGGWSTPYRIPWSRVTDVGIDIDLDLDAETTPLLNVEKQVRSFLLRLPFA